MERGSIQLVRAVIALMVGAFTFGVYLSHHQAQMDALQVAREADANRVAGLILSNMSLKNHIDDQRDRIVNIEAILVNWVQ